MARPCLPSRYAAKNQTVQRTVDVVAEEDCVIHELVCPFLGVDQGMDRPVIVVATAALQMKWVCSFGKVD